MRSTSPLKTDPSMEDPVTDNPPIAHLQGGDLAGMDALIVRYQIRATRAAYLIVRDRPLAEDIVQNAFVRLTQTIRQFDTARPFGPWFLRCVVNDAIKAARKQQRQVSLDAATDADTAAWLDHQALGGGGYLSLEQGIGEFPDRGKWQSVPQAGVEIVKIGNLDGEYTEGMFATQNGEYANWNPDAAVTRLRWQNSERRFELNKKGDPVPMEYLDRANLFALAESLTNPSTRLNLTNHTLLFLTIADAESVAGFNIAEPLTLPDEATLKRVNISMSQQWVSLDYVLDRQTSLSIGQVPIADANQLTDYSFCYPPENIETVQIGSSSGRYVGDNCLFNPSENVGPAFRTIWWYTDQNAFAIYFDTIPNSPRQLEQADLIVIAESIC